MGGSPPKASLRAQSALYSFMVNAQGHVVVTSLPLLLAFPARFACGSQAAAAAYGLVQTAQAPGVALRITATCVNVKI